MSEACATSNACKLCAPLGAVLAFRGIRGAVPFLHGSQGCSTYIRRYLIGHFREPVDIAASNFSEQAAIFGGQEVFAPGIANVVQQYEPELIGVATTCLAETIGDDMGQLVAEARSLSDVPIVHVSTPSYAGTHAEGFHRTLRALVEQMAEGGERGEHIVVVPGMVSPADLRHLRSLCQSYGLEVVLLTDYAESLDGGAWEEYQRLPSGGTSLDELRSCGRARACISFGSTLGVDEDAAAFLERDFAVPAHRLDWPLGLETSDRLHALLAELSGKPMPADQREMRSRLLDSYIDAHKYVAGRRALIYGEEDLVVAVAGFLREIGMVPAVVATGSDSGRLGARLSALGCGPETRICDDADFTDAEAAGRELGVDVIIGHSKGYWLSRRLERPLLRIGFPIHDRIGGARLRLCDHLGTQECFDRLVNLLIAEDQAANPVGYMCM